MFWHKEYSPSQNIEALLNKENVTVEEFLDEDDILQECKSQKNIINYFTRPDVIKRLIELITTEPSEDLPLTQRYRHANMACEILNLGLPSLNEKLLSDNDILRSLYSYLENEPPLNPLLSSFFSKTFSMLFTKNSFNDWFLYQKMCLQLIEYIKSQGNFLALIFKHFSTPVVTDLLMQMLNYVEGNALKRNLYEWLTEEKLVERLITILGDAKESEKHANVSEFLCDLITSGRSMRQTQQEDDSFEPAFVGSNPLLLVIESEATINSLLDIILEPSVNENAIISGILVVLTLVKPEAFVDNPATDRARIMQEQERENHENVISTVIRVVGPRLKEFIAILRNPPNKPDMLLNGAKTLPPFGSTRLEICRLFTVLLQTGNEDITNAICETDYFNTILALFKDYCWNNFLHSEVEKSMRIVFSSNSNGTNNNNNNNISNQTTKDGSFQNEDDQMNYENQLISSANAEDGVNNDGNGDRGVADGDDDSQTKANKSPSVLQTFVIVNNKIISKLIGCWMHNNEMQKAENGRRLGYMGHLMKIFKHITACISESDHIGALIESSLSETELEQWQSIIKPNDGEFTKALAVQNRMLANCNAQESVDFSQHLSKEFLNNEYIDADILTDFTTTLNNLFINMDESPMTEIFETEDMNLDTIYESIINYPKIQSSLHSFDQWHSSAADGGSVVDPFNDLSLIDQSETIGNSEPNTSPVTGGWADFSADNFADFDAHFSAFTNDMGESMGEKKDRSHLTFSDPNAPATVNFSFSSSSSSSSSDGVKSDTDNNANVEKTTKSWTDPFGDDEDEFNLYNMPRESDNGRAGGDDAWVRTTKEEETAKNETAISNGPATIQDSKDIEQLSNQLKGTTLSDSSLLLAAVTSKLATFNEDENDDDDDDEPHQSQLTSEPDLQLKPSSENITQKNNPPLPPPPSTNESLCQEQDSSNTTPITNQDLKSNTSPVEEIEITPAL